jgi:predicted DNA-binding transcriptional regulator AlpA
MAASVAPMEKESDHEWLTVPQFAERVHRSRHTVYAWIRQGKMPPNTVLDVQGHIEIDYTEFKKSIRPRGVI